MRERPSSTTVSPIPRAWTPQERALAGYAPEVAPDNLGAILLPPFTPTLDYLRAVISEQGEERLGAALYAHLHRTQLRALARVVQRLYPRTAPADKRNNRELASYITRMLTQGRYVATFEG
jgi:hypothetical protein